MNNENELTALALTIEKCREIVGCPAGVDLQDWVTQLAAENVALKQAAEFATASDMWIEQADGMLDYRYHEWYVDVLKTAMETPATDRIAAEAEARGLEKAREIVRACHDNICPGGLAENRQNEEAMVQPHLDGISDELDFEIEQLREGAK